MSKKQLREEREKKKLLLLVIMMLLIWPYKNNSELRTPICDTTNDKTHRRNATRMVLYIVCPLPIKLIRWEQTISDIKTDQQKHLSKWWPSDSLGVVLYFVVFIKSVIGCTFWTINSNCYRKEKPSSHTNFTLKKNFTWGPMSNTQCSITINYTAFIVLISETIGSWNGLLNW